MKTKRFYLALLVLLTCLAHVNAEDVITVGDVTVPKDGKVTLEIGSSFETTFIGFQLDIELADGLSLDTDAEGYVLAELGSNTTDHTFTCSKTGNVYSLLCASMQNRSLPSGSVLMRVTLVADASLETGVIIPAAIKNIVFSEKQENDQIKHVLADASFNITIDEPDDGRVLLDETSTTAPEASGEPVDVRVRRTIKANEWSTICLPFAMTEAQTKAAFGDDVQLAMFSDWSSEEDEDDDEIIVGIEIGFSSVDVADGIEANTPLLIKVTNKVDEFTVDGVTIDPEEEPSVMIKHGTKKRDPESYMIGTYQAETVLDNLTLFLNGNKFWYSTGKTKMKAYRAYFNIYDILTEVEDAYAAVKMAIDVDGTTTHVEGINMNDGEGAVYDMSGRRVSKPSQRGIYIVNGQKVLVK